MIKNNVIFFAASYRIPDIPGSFIQAYSNLQIYQIPFHHNSALLSAANTGFVSTL